MIRAVFYSIANLIFWHAPACLALELIEGAVAELLILSVCTLADSIAVPCQWYAPVLRWTKILVVPADFGTVIFVPMVFAIWPSIALPDAWDTSSVGAFELVELALPLVAVLLVTAVVAVHDPVAHQVPFQALPTGALEVPRAAFLLAVQFVRAVRAIVLRVALG